ncbi:GntR family transcriptional regulator [Bordetella bronchialis]|uniref:GntR family transcriptional regulator n=1 Tax=Bordetella bronchialis TaxID=463025 RepID=A0A193FCZ9_9BORD|nr:GntR family transcriptional regulator [Bordetella bronchialis]ANN65153.1 GntR family transcriptional regulator [Bordetella bronchialis]ANN70187.1 GntR family transcriptional regulator [Bordetella bronchialis]
MTPAAKKTPSAPRPRGRPKVRPERLVSGTRAARRVAAASAASAGDAEERVYQAVLQSVLGQRLKPGTKLPEAALCELFGVGRSLVQRVLQRLARDHVVELRPNRGAIVAVPTPEEVGKLFEARRALEAAIVPLVARHATRADYAMLRRHLRQEHQALHGGQAQWALLASAFHTRLGELSRNPLLQRYLLETVSRCALVVAIFQPPGNATCEHGEHAHVVDLIERGETAAAVRAMDQHLRDLEAHINIVQEAGSASLADMLGLG